MVELLLGLDQLLVGHPRRAGTRLLDRRKDRGARPDVLEGTQVLPGTPPLMSIPTGTGTSPTSADTASISFLVPFLGGHE